jgi:hypothetical protein
MLAFLPGVQAIVGGVLPPKAQRAAANIAKLPELLSKPQTSINPLPL